MGIPVVSKAVDSLAMKELRRRPGRFAVATIVLSFLSLLLLFLGGLLDGLYINSTGAIRAQNADGIVFSADAGESFLRSRIDDDLRATVEAADGVTDTGGIGVTLLGAAVPGEDELANVSVVGYELAPNGVPAPPNPGEAWADETLKDSGAAVGDTLLLGPAKSEVTIVGFVEDTNYLGQSGLWVELSTWRDVQTANRPFAAVADDVVQALVVRGSGVVGSIDEATNGATVTLSRDDAVLALPGIKEQNATFSQIIYTTLLIVLAVVGLFFSLLTLERLGLFGVLKAIGASSRRLFAGVAAQAVVVALIGFAVGSLAAVALAAAIPPGSIPLQLTPGRFVFTGIALVIAAVLGSLISLRRVVRIDPASAIGSAT